MFTWKVIKIRYHLEIEMIWKLNELFMLSYYSLWKLLWQNCTYQQHASEDIKITIIHWSSCKNKFTYGFSTLLSDFDYFETNKKTSELQIVRFVGVVSYNWRANSKKSVKN